MYNTKTERWLRDEARTVTERRELAQTGPKMGKIDESEYGRAVKDKLRAAIGG